MLFLDMCMWCVLIGTVLFSKKSRTAGRKVQQRSAEAEVEETTETKKEREGAQLNGRRQGDCRAPYRKATNSALHLAEFVCMYVCGRHAMRFLVRPERTLWNTSSASSSKDNSPSVTSVCCLDIALCKCTRSLLGFG